MSTTDEATTRLRATLDRVRHYSARVTLPKGTATVAADDLRTVLAALAAQTERADAAEGECARLRAAIKTQAAAVRALDASRAAISQHEQRVLRSVAGQDRATVLAQVDEAHAEAATWNARATAMESARDAAVAQREALAGAVRAYREAVDAAQEAHAATERESRLLANVQRPRESDRAEMYAAYAHERVAAAALRAASAALDALLTGGAT